MTKAVPRQAKEKRPPGMAARPARRMPLTVGEPFPWMHCRTPSNDRYKIDTVAGRYVLFFFFGSAADADSRACLDSLFTERPQFDDRRACFFGVSADPDDERLGRVEQSIPGIRFIWDADKALAAQCGVMGQDGRVRKLFYVLDVAFRVLAAVPLEGSPASCARRVIRLLDALPPPGEPAPASSFAPVQVVPRVFEPELCRTLIELHGLTGGRPTGFMREVNGKTVEVSDDAFKRRRDCIIQDDSLMRKCNERIHARLAPEIAKAFQFRATRIERYVVSCYDAEEGGFFHPHRDNTTRGTAHRRFAVSLFLNTGEYQGGMLRFPEYGQGLYSAPAGGAVVFSCSLLHEAMPVTQGRRYMFLPFLYDDAAALIRKQNQHFLALPRDAG